MNQPLILAGAGAVSPAGWSLDALAAAVLDGRIPAPDHCTRSVGEQTIDTPIRRVPPHPGTPLKSPRLRRASAIGKFAAAAAAEAIGPDRLARVADGSLRLGVVCTLFNGGVQYTNRFFGEVLADPAMASPILFPETVFNAPSSHLSATFGSTAPNDTLLGDRAEFFTGLELAAEWLERGDADGCVVVGCEECDWLTAEAAALVSPHLIASEGAAALYLEPGSSGVRLHHIPDPVSLGTRSATAAARMLRHTLDLPPSGTTVLVDSSTGHPGTDHPEADAWLDWHGPRHHPLHVLGEGMGSSAAWQSALAWWLLTRQHAEHAVVCCTGPTEQAGGAVFSRCGQPG